MKQPLILVALVALSACGTIFSIAVNMVETTEFTVEGDTLLMTGTINSKTLAQFNEIYAQNPDITTLVELSIPGSMDDDTMIALAYRVRELGLNTHLRARSEIYSGGVDLFLAGVRRTIDAGPRSVSTRGPMEPAMLLTIHVAPLSTNKTDATSKSCLAPTSSTGSPSMQHRQAIYTSCQKMKYGNLVS